MKFDEWAVRRWIEAHPDSARRIVAEYSSKFNLLGGSAGNPTEISAKTSMTYSHQVELIFDIAKMVYSSLNLQAIVESVLSVAVSIVNAERCSLFIVDKATNELYTLAFDVGTGIQDHSASGMSLNNTKSGGLMSHNSTLALNSVSINEDTDSNERAKNMTDAATKKHKPNPGFRIPIGTGVAGFVAKTRQGLNIKDAYADPRFNRAVDKQTGFKTNSILCLPIFGPISGEGVPELVGVASLINKISSQGSIEKLDQQEQTEHGKPVFNDDDASMFRNLLVLVGIAINNANQYEATKKAEQESRELAYKNAELYEKATAEREKAILMVSLAKNLYREDNTQDLVKKIVVAAKELMNADKASFFIVDKESQILTSTVFDSGSESHVVVPMNKGIAGYVATTGKTVNLHDVYTDERFNPEVDIKTNYRTKSMMSVAIYGPQNNIVGVANLINKLPKPGAMVEGDGFFTKQDEELFDSFGIFCGLALHKTMLKDEIEKQRHRLSVTMELMSFHSTIRPEETTHFQKTMSENAVKLQDLRKHTFDPHSYPKTSDTLAVITCQMFRDLSYGRVYGIPDEKLINYILTVRKNYRPVAYHNFTHAVSVTHGLYTLIVNGVLDGILDHIEMFAMFVACLNHDIDHRGTNNQFQKSAGTVLADFYSTSTMERHHFNHAMTILSHGTGLNILNHLNADDYQRVLKVIEHSIIATDLSVFFANRNKAAEIVKASTFDAKVVEHRELLRGVIMTCSDLSAMYKPFEKSQKTADSVYEEFFSQGDEEHRLGLRISAEIMDRTKMGEIPRMQSDFYNFVVMPAFDLLKGFLGDQVKNLHDGVTTNHKRWKALADSKIKYKFGLHVA